MKRLLTIGLMLASSFALTNCTEQIASPNEENVTGTNATLNTQQGDGVSIPYEVYVDGEETKTIMSAGKTYWVDASTAATNGLEQDKIILYSADAKAETPTYTAHKEFLYVGNQKFTGDLANGYELPNVANWCCIYPYPSTPNTTSTFKEKLTIGESAISVDPDCMDHMMGKEYPMYGIKNNVPISKSPNFKMSHLFAIVALEIVNEGDGITGNNDATITIKNAEFDAGVPIVGDFDVNILASENERYSNASNASNLVSLTLNQPKPLSSTNTESTTNTTTLYFAVKPFDASNREITIRINSERNTAGELTNKDFAEKKFVMPANVKFRAGKVTTIRVPVKLSSPKTSNTLTKFVTVDSKAKSKDLSINGEAVTGFVLDQTKTWVQTGTMIWDGEYTYKGHEVTITGNVTELLNALDACFYASTWEGKPSAMTVTNINFWIGDTHISNYEPLKDALAEDVGKFISECMPVLIGSGIPRDAGMLKLTDFIAPQTITFTGLVSNGSADPGNSTPNLFMLDDNTIHKQVGFDKIDELLRTKFDYTTPEGITLIPTAQGLLEIANLPANTTPSAEAIKTAKAIYGKLSEAVKGMVVSKDIVITTLTVNVENVLKGVFPDEYELIRLLPQMKASVSIGVYPYSSNPDDYGAKKAPKKPNVNMNPIIMWGFHADGIKTSSN